MATTDRLARRTFLKHLATLGAMGGSGRIVGTSPKTVAAQPAPPGPWRIGCFTRPWGEYEYRVAFDAIAEAGFRHVGLMSTKPKDDAPWALVITAATTADEARQVGQEAGRRGLKIPCTYGGRIPVQQSLEAGIRGLRRLIDNCALAGSEVLLLGGINNPSLEPPYYQAIAECCDYAAEQRVAMAIKPHGPLNATGPACRRRIASVGHERFRLWYDPGNILAYSDGKLDPVADAAAVDGLVTGMCIKDFTPERRVQVTPGTGRVDFRAVLARLEQGGFTAGPLLVETLAPGDLGTLVEEAKKARKFLEQLTEPTDGR